ncbi:leucine-rich repeat protein [uncultured Ruminococcus sp.]|uniref:leucine-rich repeat protein n=1 Tax=uncultured Ruminococcus sp. TaxID=165186 RepID=UPI0025F0C2E0|nr:leucine-rich repeat protein [uncultured Ruminococcus sp.]
MKKLLATVLALSLTFGTFALPATENNAILNELVASATAGDYYADGDYEYRVLNDGTIEIVRYNGSDTNLIIPSKIEDKEVTSIGKKAFAYCKIASVSIPNSVTNIEEYAFSYSDIESITIPNSVTSINDDTFESCEKLLSVDIPNSVTSIGSSAFANCTNLKELTIPDSVTVIKGCAFEGCTNLENISIPNNVISIGGNAFENTLWINEQLENNSLVIVNNILIYSNRNIVEVTIPDNVTSIGDNAFNGNNNLKKVTIPKSVAYIGNGAFSGCSELESIIIPDTVNSIDDSAFSDCWNLTTVSIPGSVSNIGACAFSGCTNLESVAISEGVLNIDYKAFENCKNLANVSIPSSVINIGYNAFNNTIWLKQQSGEYVIVNGILISVSVTTEKITIPKDVKTIGNGAFFRCSLITDITIPDSVTTISDNAFAECGKIKDVYYTGTKSSWNKIQIGESNWWLTNANIHYHYGKPHSYIETITQEPTCTEDGVKTKTCANCNDKITESIPKTGHVPEDEFHFVKKNEIYKCYFETKNAKKCIICGEIISSESIGRYEHTSSDWIIDKNAAINVKGSKHKECKVCKTVLETAEIPALPMISIQGASVSVSTSSYIFDNTAKTPSVTVTLNGKTLKNGVDYTVSYSNNKNVGLGIVTITGKGDYAGTIAKNFKIYPAKQSIQKLETRYKGFFVDWVQKGSATGYEVQYSTSSSMSGAVTKKLTANKPDTLTVSKLKSGKKYYVRVRSYTNVNGEVYYGNWSNVKSITTAKTNFKKAKISGIKTKSYTGKAIKQSIKVTYNGKVLKNGKNYTISYLNNKKVGTAKVTIKGKGTYGGVITKTFKINPAKQKIKSLKAKSKGFTVNWAQKDSGTGYEIQYSTNSSFKGATKKTVKNKKTSKATYSKLKAKKKYYVRVRTYTDVNGTRYYGSWSAAKSVTTKK